MLGCSGLSKEARSLGPCFARSFLQKPFNITLTIDVWNDFLPKKRGGGGEGKETQSSTNRAIRYGNAPVTPNPFPLGPPTSHCWIRCALITFSHITFVPDFRSQLWWSVRRFLFTPIPHNLSITVTICSRQGRGVGSGRPLLNSGLLWRALYFIAGR